MTMHRAAPLLLLLLALAAPVRTTAQPGTDEQLAAQYFQQGDYERAALYYEKLYRKNPTPYYYEQLFRSYLELRRYDEAEKIARDQQRKSDDPRYFVDLGSLYKTTGDAEKSAQQFEKALKQVNGDANRVRTVANAFTRANELDLAIEAYERGQRQVRDGTSFHYEIANLYAAKGDVPGMVRGFMDVLEQNEGYIQSVQNSLGRHIDFDKRDERSDVLRTELLRRIQKSPDKAIFPDLLIWMYIQQKDMTSALVQSKAMDKRLNEGGRRVMELGDIALANRDHANAVKCYEYVTGLGREKPLYLNARLNMVRALHSKVTEQAEPPQEELLQLQASYEQAMAELGRSPITTQLLKGLAEVLAYWLNDVPGAITLLDEAINTPGVDAQTQAQYKLALGDVHVLGGDIWEASLLYSQVDLDFKYDVIGNEARLRNARVSFYSGDMLWSLAQLDILKTSTSKLIANDAMELSLLISDNIGADSNSVPLGLYAQAQLLTFQHRYEEALGMLDSLERTFPMHTLSDDILYQRYRVAYARRRFTDAAALLEKVIELHPLEILVDNAMLDLGRLYEEHLGDPDKAKGWYEKLLFEQTGSIFVPEARDRFRRLRGDHADPSTPEEKFLHQGVAP